MPEREFIKIEDLARRWAVSGGKIRRMLREGQLAGVKICNTWRIPVDIIVEYESRNTSKAVPAETNPEEAPRPVVRAIL